MASDHGVLHRYASALHVLAAEAGAVERVATDLDGLSAAITASPELAGQLASPRLPREAKRALITALCAGRAHDLVRRVALLAVDKGRAAQVADLGAAFRIVARKAAGRVVASVQSAQPLDAATRAGLVAGLGRLTGNTIELEESLDADLIGGLRVVIGSRMLDGSVTARLERMRARMLAAPLGAAAQ